MAQMTSGKVLREARERKDYDLTTVARRLRIRPDILRAIEAGDFSAMPPRGYARNMVNAYARLLGLNPTEIVNMYLDEAYAYQVEKARDAAPGRGFAMESDFTRRPRLRSRSTSGAESRSSRDDNSWSSSLYSDEMRPASEGRSRHLYDDRTRYSRDDYGVTRSRVERPGRSDRDFLSHHSGYSTMNYAEYGNQARQRRGGRDIRVGETPMQYSASRMPAFLQSRWVIIVAALLVVIAIVAILVFVVGNRNAPAQDDVSKLPVSGITDTTGTSDEKEAQASQVEVAPTSARVVYTVSKGDDCYVETYTDGAAAVGEMMSGPAQNTVDVTGTWTIATWSPETVKVTVDGEEVKLTTNQEYGGMYAYTVDFTTILNEWKSTHNSKASQRQAAVASASNAASQAQEEDEEESSSSSSSNSTESSSSSASAGSAR